MEYSGGSNVQTLNVFQESMLVDLKVNFRRPLEFRACGSSRAERANFLVSVSSSTAAKQPSLGDSSR